MFMDDDRLVSFDDDDDTSMEPRDRSTSGESVLLLLPSLSLLPSFPLVPPPLPLLFLFVHARTFANCP